MKKLIFFALAVIAFASCSNQQKYTVKGTVSDESFNGSKVVFCKFEKGNIVQDTVNIDKNVFEYKGGIDTARLINAYVLYNNEPQHFQVVLEKGDITVAVEKGKVTVGGTPLNLVLQEYTNKEADAIKKVTVLSNDYQAKVAAGTVTEEETNAYTQQYSAISNEFGRYSMDFIKTNINNTVGKTFFANKIIYMGGKEKEEMLSFATDDLKALYAPQK